ncbi:MAG: PA14 domain-containing protein, partial [Planctomycetales bacterium]
PTLATSVPLGNLNHKYTLPSLGQFLRDPHKVRASGRMPSLNLSGQDARDVAAFLLSDLKSVANVKYSYYEGNWNDNTDFIKLKPKATGGTAEINVKPKQRDNQFGLMFEGFLRIDQEGEYTFHIGSDDGSKLIINDKVVVNNGGTHPYQVKSGKTRLAAGLHPLVLTYYEGGGEEKLTAEFEGSGLKRQPIAAAMTISKEVPQRELLAISVKANLADQGRKLFASVGCASCHQLRDKNKLVVSSLKAPSLKQLKTSGGCLDAAPRKGLPHYSLSDSQRKSLASAVAAAKKTSSSPTGEKAVAAAMTTFNCYACHQRTNVGGPEELRDALFQTTQKEMGDEGRIPPPLDGVGAKLTEKWMKSLLAHGANDRPYMHTRMPNFGEANVGRLTKLFQELDVLDPAPKVASKETVVKVKQAGWRMVGAKGFACIKCHSFGPYRATGIQSIDLTIMSERLKPDWFKQYMRDPQRFRKGTRMPAPWPPNLNVSLLPDVLDGKPETQIHAVWTYLGDKNKARTPTGLVTNSMELIPFNEAIIYRNFIQGGGPRAIGVGYPAGRNLAFDAYQMSLAMLWQGSFIDAKKHWSGRGQGFQNPAGTNVLRFPAQAPFATLDSGEAPWPKEPSKEIGYKFRGYRLTTDQRPTFLYSYDGIQIADFPNPVAGDSKTTVKRTITLTTDKPAKLYYRAAVGGKIEPTGSGSFQIDDAWTTVLQHETVGDAMTRKQGGQVELLLPVLFNKGKATIAQEYIW